MKPLPENHFTIEDWDVIIDVVLRCGRIVDGSMFGYWVMERGKQSDRRDAELMLYAQEWRKMPWRTVEWGELNQGWLGPLFRGNVMLGGRRP